MPIEVRMPKLSDNMESGTIIRWLKQEGDSVHAGEPLAEVETDKADVELEAEEEGILREIRVAQGQSAAVGDVIAVLAADGEAGDRADTAGDGEVPQEKEQDQGKETEGKHERTTAAPEQKKAEGAEVRRSEPTDGKKRVTPKPLAQASAAPSAKAERPVRASPLAWRIAQEAGLSLAGVKGSGPAGRILRRDVEALLAHGGKAAAGEGSQPGKKVDGVAQGDGRRRDGRRRDESEGEQPPTQRKSEQGESSAGTDGDEEAPPAGRLQEQSRMRLTIARRMAEANREIPQFYLTSEIDMSDAWRLRLAIKESGTIPGLTLTHVIGRAVALALTEHPRVNASWRDGAVEFHDDVNLGIAVAIEDGLIVPVLHRAQEMSLRDLSVRSHALTGKARSGHFAGGDLTGATFTISNLGVLDVDEFTAVITPPQAAILAVGIVKERPVVRSGQLAVARTMRVTMSCDHRILNGAEGAEFLEEVKRLLEAPHVLLAAG